MLYPAKRSYFVATLALGLMAGAANAATYYVRKDGSDTTCNGTADAAADAAPNCAFLTIQKSSKTASGGDGVTIQPGTYAETVTLGKSGAEGAPITFTGAGAVIRGNVKATGRYVSIDGVTISPPTAGGWSAISLLGDHIVLKNCLVTNYGARASDQATAIGLEGGSFNTVEGCTIRDLNDIDVFHVWGHDHVIRNNKVTNIQTVNYSQNHSDFIQTWGYAGAQSYNILIDGNEVTNSTCQLGNTETDGETGLHDWTFRNNIFANVESALFWGLPKTRFYNNTFYNVGKAQGYALSVYAPATPPELEIVNNAFVANVVDVNFQGSSISQLKAYSNNYFATASGAVKNGANGSNVVNGGEAKYVSAPTADFHLGPGSVLTGRGADLSASFSNDKDGNTRAVPWDIGSYKYGSGASIAPPQNLTVK